MVSEVRSETTKEAQKKTVRVQCSAPARRICCEGRSELDYLDYTIRKSAVSVVAFQK